ncbi:hypothetical protein [Sphingobacterium sp. LRF_L2]|uniref:hypothetical protein n=1 Tax=Sphingobacterium sp. LRF_L2 TaxID=3369421 RepID=UPI003F63C7C6
MRYSRGKWTIGKTGGAVVTNDGFGFPDRTGHSDIVHYGGYLIAESIYKVEDAQLISAVPDMLEALKIAVGIVEKEPTKFTKEEKLKFCIDAINKAEGASIEMELGKPINNFLKSIK